MGYEEIRQLCEMRQDDWPDRVICPTAYDGTSDFMVINHLDNTPEGVSEVADAIRNRMPWCRFQIEHTDSSVMSLGNRPYTRRRGAVLIQIFTPDLTGTAQAAKLADSLSWHWQYWYPWGFETLSPEVTRVGASNDWFHYQVWVPWRTMCCSQ